MKLSSDLANVAAEKKRSGRYNCAQAVACTYAGAVGAPVDVIEATAAAFGTGMGTLRGTCGALVGAGIIYGYATADRVKARAGMKRMFEGFENRIGATQCAMLKGVGNGKPLAACEECVAEAARQLELQLAEIEPVSR